MKAVKFQDLIGAASDDLFVLEELLLTASIKLEGCDLPAKDKLHEGILIVNFVGNQLKTMRGKFNKYN